MGRLVAPKRLEADAGRFAAPGWLEGDVGRLAAPKRLDADDGRLLAPNRLEAASEDRDIFFLPLLHPLLMSQFSFVSSIFGPGDGIAAECEAATVGAGATLPRDEQRQPEPHVSAPRSGDGLAVECEVATGGAGATLPRDEQRQPEPHISAPRS